MKALPLFNRIKNNERIRKLSYFTILSSLFLYIFSIPSFSGRAKWNLLSYFFMAALLFSVIFYTTFYKKWVFDRKLIIPSAFVLSALIGTTFYSHAFFGVSGKIGWSSLVLMLLTFFTFYFSFLAIENPRLILKMLVVAFFLFAIYFAFHYRDKIIHLKLNSSRLGGYFDGINSIGFYFSVGFTIALYLALLRRRKFELVYLIPAFTFLFLGLFTGSRAFIVCTIIGGLVTVFVRLRKHLLLFIIILITVVALIFILIKIPQLSYLKDQIDRAMYTLFGVGQSKVDTSTIQRVLWPKYAFYLAGKNMIFGYGVGGFGDFSGIGTYAHNNFAEVICNFGIIGFILYYLSFAYPFLLSINKGKGKSVVTILFFIYIIRSFFGVTYYSKESYLVLALCFYLVKEYSINDLFFMRNNQSAKYNYCEVSI